MELDISNIASQFDTFEQMKESRGYVKVAQQDEDEFADFLDLGTFVAHHEPGLGSTPLHYML